MLALAVKDALLCLIATNIQVALEEFGDSRQIFSMHWIALESEAQLAEIKNNSTLSLIFKHSTRCHISHMVLRSFEKEWNENANIQTYFLDLLAYPNLSREIANIFQVHHESPQALLIKNGECIFDASHNEISAQEILAEAATN